MSDHVYKKVEIVGSSPNGFEEAVQNALARAKKTLRNMRWFEVTETRGFVEDGKIAHWQVTLKIGFTLEENVAGRSARDAEYRKHALAARHVNLQRHCSSWAAWYSLAAP